MKHSRRQHLAFGLSALAAYGLPSLASAQAPWPARPVRMIVGSAAGGGTDLFARLLAERFGALFGQAFIVDNKPGANGLLASEAAARAPADGYTLLFSYAGAMLINPMLHNKKNLDPLKDFEPIAQVGAVGNVLVVNAAFPVRNLKELAAYAKANPGKLSYGSWGIGSGGHLTMESFLASAGLQMTHAPYKGVAPLTSDLLGGVLQVGWIDVSSQVQQIQSGKLRAIAVSGTDHMPQLPDVPTMAEQGFPFDTMSWYGLFAPARTPADIVRQLHAASLKTIALPEFRARLASFNIANPPAPSIEEFRQRIAQDTRVWAGIVQAAGVKAE